MIQFLMFFFGVKESDKNVCFVIRGQVEPSRSPKGHLNAISGIFWVYFEFMPIFGYFRKIENNI